ncbi:MAG TPA: hypothetical protein VFD93_00945 [Candidatus Acidoferrales bacterium]|nr:hypothetical protein [Candidatus Acidoferrales bacterium]
MTRRIQSAALILALLAAPLALLSRSYACAASQCTMMCCLPHKHARAMSMHCQSDAAGACAMHCDSQKNLDYGLASPLPPTQLRAAFTLPAPEPAEMLFLAHNPRVANGFSRIPLEPPRL